MAVSPYVPTQPNATPLTSRHLTACAQGAQYLDHRGWLCWQLGSATYDYTREDTALSDLFTDTAAKVERVVLGGEEPAAPLGRIRVINANFYTVGVHALMHSFARGEDGSGVWQALLGENSCACGDTVWQCLDACGCSGTARTLACLCFLLPCRLELLPGGDSLRDGDDKLRSSVASHGSNAHKPPTSLGLPAFWRLRLTCSWSKDFRPARCLPASPAPRLRSPVQHYWEQQQQQQQQQPLLQLAPMATRCQSPRQLQAQLQAQRQAPRRLRRVEGQRARAQGKPRGPPSLPSSWRSTSCWI